MIRLPHATVKILAWRVPELAHAESSLALINCCLASACVARLLKYLVKVQSELNRIEWPFR